MKCMMLATATAVTLSSFAMVGECIAGPEQLNASEPVLGSVPQKAVTAIKIAMGPTSAPQKPGGMGGEPNETRKLHKKAKHKHRHS